MNDKKGVQQNISFSTGNIDLYEYVAKMADNQHGGIFSNAIMECIRAHRNNGDKLQRVLNAILNIEEKIDNLEIVGIGAKEKEEIKKQVGFNLDGNLFE